MVSKQNCKQRRQVEAERRPHYGLRKLSLGVASVLLSTTLYWYCGAANVAQAATVKGSAAQPTISAPEPTAVLANQPIPAQPTADPINTPSSPTATDPIKDLTATTSLQAVAKTVGKYQVQTVVNNPAKRSLAYTWLGMNVPTQADGKSQFDTQLTGPVTVKNGTDAASLDLAPQMDIFYSPKTINFKTWPNDVDYAAIEELNLVNGKTLDKSTKWSQYKSVLVLPDNAMNDGTEEPWALKAMGAGSQTQPGTKVVVTMPLVDHAAAENQGKTLYGSMGMVSHQLPTSVPDDPIAGPTGEDQLVFTVVNPGSAKSPKVVAAKVITHGQIYALMRYFYAPVVLNDPTANVTTLQADQVTGDSWDQLSPAIQAALAAVGYDPENGTYFTGAFAGRVAVYTQAPGQKTPVLIGFHQDLGPGDLTENNTTNVKDAWQVRSSLDMIGQDTGLLPDADDYYMHTMEGPLTAVKFPPLLQKLGYEYQGYYKSQEPIIDEDGNSDPEAVVAMNLDQPKDPSPAPTKEGPASELSFQPVPVPELTLTSAKINQRLGITSQTPNGVNDKWDLQTPFSIKDTINVYPVFRAKAVTLTSTSHPNAGQAVPSEPGFVYPQNHFDVSQLKKTVTRTIKFVDDKDKAVHAQIEQPVTLTRTATMNLATGEVTLNNDWSHGDFVAVTLPVVDKYRLNPTNQSIPSVPVTTATNDQTVTIYYQHQTETLPNENKTVTQTIEVKDPITGKVTTTKQTARFSRTATKDLVTGVTMPGAWSADQQWATFTTPTVTGYTPTKTSVPEQAVTADDADQTVTITYTANPTSVNVIFQDHDGTQIGKTQTINGVVNGTVDTTEKTVPTGWLVDGTDPRTKDLKVGVKNADVIVKLKHGTEAQTPDTNTVTRTIKVTDPLTGQVTIIKQTAHFSRTATKDLVTNKVTYGPWSADEKWPKYETPVVPGYKAMPVPEAIVTPNMKDQNVTVTYQPTIGTMTVNYVDEITGKVVATETVSGPLGQSVALMKEAALEETGYELPSVQQVTIEPNQSIETVTLKHRQVPTSQIVTVIRTIKFVVAGGLSVAPKQVQTATFKQTGTKDAVTGTYTWTGSTPQTFAAVVSPAVPGYTPIAALVPAMTVTSMTASATVLVKYTHDVSAPELVSQSTPAPQPMPQPTPGREQLGSQQGSQLLNKAMAANGTQLPKGATPAAITTGTKKTLVHSRIKAAKQALPQTGNDQARGALTLGIIGLSAAMALLGLRKQRP